MKLINLLANAIKFTANTKRRVITLTLDASLSRPHLPGEGFDDSVDIGDVDMVAESRVNLVFGVSDTGVGMADAEIQRLFQRFTQGSNRTHLTYGGSGLGEFGFWIGFAHVDTLTLVKVYSFVAGSRNYSAVCLSPL
jgi:signal transduction histidine kinase